MRLRRAAPLILGSTFLIALAGIACDKTGNFNDIVQTTTAQQKIANVTMSIPERTKQVNQRFAKFQSSGARLSHDPPIALLSSTRPHFPPEICCGPFSCPARNST